ncbi:MAG TPA: hypothetical protein PKW33_00710 [Anaerolineaceae bacterium]|nr:hypothetical protein [Anaerolineaceae bacterium]HPN50078.1 hypothetical protein [Anaerolineaceae bacterium]
MAKKTKSTQPKPRSTPHTVDNDDILEVVGLQGVATALQVQQWYGAKKDSGIRTRMTNMCRGNNPPLTNRNLPLPWKSPYNVQSAFLSDIGASILNERHGTSIIAPSPTTQMKNFVHGLGLVEIAIALKNMGIPFDLERRVDIDEEEGAFIRPDVLCRVNGTRYLIEFEQTRSEQELSERLLGRLHRWQKAFTSPGMEDVSTDVIVLFALKKPDDHTLSKWSEALYKLSQDLQRLPAFSVWAMPINDFIKTPTFDLRLYMPLYPSDHPDADGLAAERESFFSRQLGAILPPEKIQSAMESTYAYCHEYRGRLSPLQSSPAERKQFLDACDAFFNMAYSGRDFDYHNGSIPWIGIGILRYWIEQPVFADFRIRLIDALEKFKSSYGRGLNSAADTLERLVWDTLLRQFGIGRDGPLSFYAQIGTTEKDKDRRSGLVPVFTISAPWIGVRENQEQADATIQSLTWFVTMLMDYSVELGLTKDNKKAQSSVVLDSRRQKSAANSDAQLSDDD